MDSQIRLTVGDCVFVFDRREPSDLLGLSVASAEKMPMIKSSPNNAVNRILKRIFVALAAGNMEG